MKKNFKQAVAILMSLQFCCISMVTVFANEKIMSFTPNEELLSINKTDNMSGKEQKVIVKFKDKQKKGKIYK